MAARRHAIDTSAVELSRVAKTVLRPKRQLGRCLCIGRLTAQADGHFLVTR